MNPQPNPNQPNQPGFPMPVLWATVDDMVAQYVQHLKTNQMTTSDVAMGLLGQLEGIQGRLVMAMLAATALQRLAAGGPS